MRVVASPSAVIVTKIASRWSIHKHASFFIYLVPFLLDTLIDKLPGNNVGVLQISVGFFELLPGGDVA
jgi:hypothetical protein